MIEGILIGGGVMGIGVIIGALIVSSTIEYIWGDENDSENENEN